MLLAKSPISYETLAETQDSAIGRAIDKVAHALGMRPAPIGLGAGLEAFCSGGASDIPLPEDAHHLDMSPAMRGRLAFTYGGLQSAFQRWAHSRGGAENIDEDSRRAVARAFQRTVFRQLEEKVILGLRACARKDIHINHVVVSGGVASTIYLRDRYVSHGGSDATRS